MGGGGRGSGLGAAVLAPGRIHVDVWQGKIVL